MLGVDGSPTSVHLLISSPPAISKMRWRWRRKKLTSTPLARPCKSDYTTVACPEQHRILVYDCPGANSSTSSHSILWDRPLFTPIIHPFCRQSSDPIKSKVEFEAIDHIGLGQEHDVRPAVLGIWDDTSLCERP